MKLVKKGIIAVIMLSTVFTTYPQAMWISSYVNNSYVDKVVVDKTYKAKNDYLIIDVVIPQFKGTPNEESEKNINDSIVKWTESWIDEAKQIADEYFKDGIAPTFPYQLISKYEVTNKRKVISLYIDYYQYTGGAHGITTRNAYSVDSATSKLLKLKDLFTDNYNYKEPIDLEIEKQIQLDPDKYFCGKQGFNGIDDTTKFYIKNGELIIYYGSYEIAPYASGLPEFKIPTSIFKGNFRYGTI